MKSLVRTCSHIYQDLELFKPDTKEETKFGVLYEASCEGQNRREELLWIVTDSYYSYVFKLLLSLNFLVMFVHLSYLK
jgi:hypothetical protein